MLFSSIVQVLFYHFMHSLCSIFHSLKDLVFFFCIPKGTKKITREWHMVLDMLFSCSSCWWRQSSVSMLVYQESWIKLDLGNWCVLALRRDVGVIYAFMSWKINIPHINAKILPCLPLSNHSYEFPCTAITADDTNDVFLSLMWITHSPESVLDWGLLYFRCILVIFFLF